MDDIVNNEEVCVLVCVCVHAFFLEIKYLLDCFFSSPLRLLSGSAFLSASPVFLPARLPDFQAKRSPQRPSPRCCSRVLLCSPVK